MIAAQKLNDQPGDYVASDETDSAALWNLSRQWIRNCCENHPDCSTRSETWAPTRLIDLGTIDSSHVRLVDSKEHQIGDPYMSLSHCWGQGGLIKSTTATIGFLRTGIPISQLPTLYQDAVTVCKRLGIRYLWIDSLCIIQDQESDCIREIAVMGQVYTNALCNIEATDAENGLGRLFFSRSGTRIRSTPVSVEWYEEGPREFFLFDNMLFRENATSAAPLMKRAWVLQEQLLAPRTLAFGKTQVYWVCKTHEASEAFPSGVPDLRTGRELLTHSLAPRPLHYLKGLVASDSPVYYHPPSLANWSEPSPWHVSPWESFWMCWRSIVIDYTSRSLTFEKDKLAAIAGLASVLQRDQKCSYLAGMWNSQWDVQFELCWKAGPQCNGQPPYRPKEYRAPSWSWASVEGSISYDYKEDHDLTGERGVSFVEDSEIRTVDGTSTGPVKSGFLRIKGPLVGKHNGRYYPDDKAEPRPTTVYYLTVVASSCYEARGLALRKLESGPDQGCYQRVGMFRACDDQEYEICTEAPEQLITIV